MTCLSSHLVGRPSCDESLSSTYLEASSDNLSCITGAAIITSSNITIEAGLRRSDKEGETLGVNEDFNGTGACIGGFEGYTGGMDFMMDSTRAARGKLSVGYEVGEWGPFVHTIGSLNANSVTGDFRGAYWNLDHNGATSMVGIGDLVMAEGDVISWSIGTW